MRFLLLVVIGVCCGMALGETSSSETVKRLKMILEKYEDYRKNCSSEISIDDIDYDSSKMKDEKCFFACILKKASILNGEEFSRKIMNEMASFVFYNEPELESLVHQVHLDCEKKLAEMKMTDECEIGNEIHLCLQKGWKEAGFKYWSTKLQSSVKEP